MRSYSYLRIKFLPRGAPIVMGLITVFMIVPEEPFFYCSGNLTKRFGLTKISGLALVCVFLRQAGTAILGT